MFHSSIVVRYQFIHKTYSIQRHFQQVMIWRILRINWTFLFSFEQYCYILAYAITPYNWMYTPPKFYLSTSKSIGVGIDFKDCYHNHKFVIICLLIKLYSQWRRFKTIDVFSQCGDIIYPIQSYLHIIYSFFEPSQLNFKNQRPLYLLNQYAINSNMEIDFENVLEQYALIIQPGILISHQIIRNCSNYLFGA